MKVNTTAITLALIAAIPFFGLACFDSGGGSEENGDTEDTDDTETATDTGSEYDGECEPSDIQAGRIFDDVDYLASAVCGGREPGTAGGEAALVYVEDIYESAGLLPMGDSGTYRQAFNAWGHSIEGSPGVSINDVPLEKGRDFDVAFGSGSGRIEADLRYAGSGIVVPPFNRSEYPDCPYDATGYDDFESRGALNGSVVWVTHDEKRIAALGCPSDPNLCQKGNCLRDAGYIAAGARRSGVSAVVFVRKDGAASKHLFQRITKPYYHSDFPAISVPESTFERLVKGANAPRIVLDIETTARSVATHNLLGAIEGTDPALQDEVVIIGGHIDHMGMEYGEMMPGADDNASGTAVVAEIARVFQECQFEPKRTILFAAWNAEEWGLVGSGYYVDNPVYPLGNTVAYLNLDMMGQGDESTMTLYDADTWLKGIVMQASEDAGLPYAFESGPMDWPASSDHANFTYSGIPALFEMSGYGIADHDYTHTPQDTIDAIQVGALKASAEITMVAFIALAMGA